MHTGGFYLQVNNQEQNMSQLKHFYWKPWENMQLVLGILQGCALHLQAHCTSILGRIHSLYGLLHQLQVQWGDCLRQHSRGSSFVLIVASSAPEELTTNEMFQSNWEMISNIKQFLLWLFNMVPSTQHATVNTQPHVSYEHSH